MTILSRASGGEQNSAYDSTRSALRAVPGGQCFPTTTRGGRMTARALALLALAAGVAPSTTTKYRVDQTVDQAVDATAIGGAEQRQRFTVSTFLTVTLTDTS